MAEKFVLVDAHSIIFRSYFAFIKNPLKNSKGVNTSGVFGFLNTLEKIKKRLVTDYLGLAFDAPGETFREKEFKEYKANRPAAPADIPFQIAKSKELAQHLGLALYELEGYEADDILATIAMKLKNFGTVYIVSSDKDLLQLVSDKIFVYDAYRDEIFDRDKVIEKYGLPPERIVEYLALTGDAIDNVPGVPGIGPKRALEIITGYPNFEEAIDKDERLKIHKAMILLSKKLITLEHNVPLNIQPKDLLIKKSDMDKLMPILLELEFHSYIKEYSSRYQIPLKVKETEDLSEIKLGEIAGIGPDEKNEMYICNAENSVYKLLAGNTKKLLANSHIIKVGSDFKTLAKRFDIKPPVFDLEIAAWLIDPNKKSYTLNDITLQNLQIFSEITPAHVAYLAFQLYPILNRKLEELGEQELYQKIEEPLIYVLASMEKRGIKIDLSYLKSFGEELKHEISRMEKDIYRQSGKEFNLNSPKQLSQVLFEDLKLKPSKKGKTHYSTDVEVLQQLALSHPLPEEILRYRELTKIKSTYVEPLLAVAKKGRVHTTFNQTGTSTGRLSSSNPNIQNIPIRTEIGRKIRKGFIAEPGFVLISADYSQIELRLLAHITEDKNLIQAFKQGSDIHSHTASLVFNIPEDRVDDKARRMAKVVNYGLIYGMSDYGLAQGLDIPQAQATEFIQTYYTLYPQVNQWREQAIAAAEKKGLTETLFGRKRPLFEIHSNNHALREFSKRAAINTPIQGTAADLIKLAMIRVEKELDKAKFTSGLLLSIHDELLFEIEEKRVAEAKAIIKEGMEKVMKLVVPIEVSIGVGKDWGEAH